MNQNTLSKFKRVQYTKEQINQMKLQLQSKNTQQDFKSLNNNIFKKINTQYVNNGQLQIEFDPTTNKIFFNDVSSNTKYYINANNGNTDLNVNLEGKIVNNMQINNLTSNSILLNATDGNKYNIETDIRTTDQEQTVQDERLDTLEEEMKHLFDNLSQYVTPQMLYGQYFFSTKTLMDQDQETLGPKNYQYNDINKEQFLCPNMYVSTNSPQYAYPQFNWNNFQKYYIQGISSEDNGLLSYDQCVQAYPTNLSTTFDQNWTFLNNTNFYEGGIFFFLTTKNNQVFHINNNNFDLIQINSNCIYNGQIENLYENFSNLNISYQSSIVSGESRYEFSYQKIHSQIGVFVCLTRKGDFDLTKLTYTGSQDSDSTIITERSFKQYDSQFFKDQVIISYMPETITLNNKSYTFDIQQQANTYCICLQKLDITLNTNQYGDLSYKGRVYAYKAVLNFDYEELVEQVKQMELQIVDLQTFQKQQDLINIDFDTRISTNTNNISTNTTNLNSQIQKESQDVQTLQTNIDNCLKPSNIIDNLNSTSTTDCLSANQGYILNNLINSKQSYTVLTAGDYLLQDMSYGSYLVESDNISISGNVSQQTPYQTTINNSTIIVFGSTSEHQCYIFNVNGFIHMTKTKVEKFFTSNYQDAYNKAEEIYTDYLKSTNIIDNLNSTSITDCLSANQGYILNNLINSKQPYTILTAGTYDLQNLDYGTYQIRNDSIVLYGNKTSYPSNALTLPTNSIMFVFGSDGYHIMYDFYNLGYYYMLPSLCNVFYYNWYVGAVNKSDTIYQDYLKSTNILDSLTSTSTTDCLSANQGKVLNDKISSISTSSSGITLLTENTNYSLQSMDPGIYINTNKTKIWNNEISGATYVLNDYSVILVYKNTSGDKYAIHFSYIGGITFQSKTGQMSFSNTDIKNLQSDMETCKTDIEDLQTQITDMKTNNGLV